MYFSFSVSVLNEFLRCIYFVEITLIHYWFENHDLIRETFHKTKTIKYQRIIICGNEIQTYLVIKTKPIIDKSNKTKY